MKLEMYQVVVLKTGKKGAILEIFNDGEAYLIDVKTDDGEYEQVTAYPRDIRSVIVEVERPFATA